MDTAVPAEGNGDLQTLICVLVARPRRCPTLSNSVLWQNWMAAYLSTLCGWRRCIVADQLWFMTRIREEDLPTLAKYLCHFGPVKTCVLGHIYITSTITFYRCVVFMIGCVYGVRCSRPVDQLTDVVTRLDLNHNISPSQVRITCTLVTHIIITCTGTYHSRYVSYVCVSPVHILPALITCTLISNTRYTYHLWRYVSPVHVSSVQVHITYTCITCTGTYHLYAYHLYRYVSPVHVSPVLITYMHITCTGTYQSINQEFLKWPK